MHLRNPLTCLVLIAVCFAVACQDGNDDHDDPDNSVDDDDVGLSDDDDDAAACPGVVWDYLTIDSVPAPPNPITGAESPPEFDKVKYFRFRADTAGAPPDEVNAVMIMLPGYSVGAGYLTYLAENLVALSCGRIEVWISERRHHLLEDTTGMDAAEAAKDPDLAYSYYYEGGQVNGSTFDGFLSAYGQQTDFLSEWGLELALKDIRRLIEQVPQAGRQTSVFLAGHSRGGFYVKAYAAHVFKDGHRGCDDLAGAILVDGESRYLPIFTKSLYETTINAVRRGILPRYITLPPFGPPVYTYFEIMAMTASEDFSNPDDPRLGPDGVYGKYGPFTYLLPLLYRFEDMTLTNEALLGYATDAESGLISLLLAGFGKLDGPTATDALGVYPTDSDHLYRWKHYNQVTPGEFSEIQDFIHGLYEGPSNAMDPYYGTRLDIDYWAAEFFENEDQWQSEYFLFKNSTMDAPVFVLGSRLLYEKSDHVFFYRSQLPPVRGQNLPRDQFGFDVMWHPEWEHLDTAFAVAKTNDFFQMILDWMEFFSTGTTRIP